MLKLNLFAVIHEALTVQGLTKISIAKPNQMSNFYFLIFNRICFAAWLPG